MRPQNHYTVNYYNGENRIYLSDLNLWPAQISKVYKFVYIFGNK